MQRHLVKSEAIKSIGHEGDVLEVEMKSGKVYRYRGVSPAAHADLISATSVGKHFGAHVRGKFEHTLVEPTADEKGQRG